MKVSYIANVYEVTVGTTAEGVIQVHLDSLGNGHRLTYTRGQFICNKDIVVVCEEDELDVLTSTSVKSAYVEGWDDGHYDGLVTGVRQGKEAAAKASLRF